jgi:hypothetical protein
MLENEELDVINYLQNLKQYLFGDLDNYEKFCALAQQNESSSSKIVNNKPTSSVAPIEHEEPESNNILNPISDDSSYSYYNPSIFFDFKKDSNGQFFRSTIPHTLAIFSSIDILGFLISEETEPTKTKENFQTFFKGTSYLSDIEFEALIFLYRHGMVHTYFPKGEIGIIYDINSLGNKIFYLVDDMIVLNVKRLIAITKEHFEEIFNNSSLHENMKTQLILLKRHESKKSETLTKLKKQLSLIAIIPKA